MDYEASKKILKHMAIEVLKNGLPDQVNILNINVPQGAEISTDIRITNQARSNYAIYFDKVISITPLTWNLSVKIDWKF